MSTTQRATEGSFTLEGIIRLFTESQRFGVAAFTSAKERPELFAAQTMSVNTQHARELGVEGGIAEA